MDPTIMINAVEIVYHLHFNQLLCFNLKLFIKYFTQIMRFT